MEERRPLLAPEKPVRRGVFRPIDAGGVRRPVTKDVAVGLGPVVIRRRVRRMLELASLNVEAVDPQWC